DKIDLDDWSSGVEEYAECDLDTMWAALGREKEHTLPFFNTMEDPSGSTDAWSPEGQTALKSGSAVSLTPRWHQLVGIVKMLVNMFEGKPVLLMDEVGVGKTMQVIGFICMHAWLHQVYKQTKRYPGMFAKYSKEIEDLPTLISVPVTLHKQMTNEIHRYVQWKEFDLLPYTGTTASRAKWWDLVWKKVKHQPIRRIVLATIKAITSDATDMFTQADDKSADGTPRYPEPGEWAEASAQTVYGQQWGALIVDEIHEVRTLNKSYMAIRMARKQSGMTIGMSATPGITNAMDFAAIGWVLGIKAFSEGAAELLQWKRNLAAAKRRDAASMKRDEEASSKLKSVLTGSMDAEADTMIKGEYVPMLEKTMEVCRRLFIGHIARRTLRSLDFAGQAISGLPDYHEIILPLKMSDAEMDLFERLAEEFAERSEKGKGRAGKDFYLGFRRSLSHPANYPPSGWKIPQTKEEFDVQPSTKLRLAITIILYHLKKDQPVPLRRKYGICFNTDEMGKYPKCNKLWPDEGYQYRSRGDPDHPDKIVMYSAFPANNAVLLRVLAFYDIKYLVLNGDVPANKRPLIIDQFKNGGRDDPRVLVMSSVGITGLNLPEASILIFLDTTWSALEDAQMTGRLWRLGQLKDVWVYRLLCLKTPDVYLNIMSYDKWIMHSAFVKADPRTRKYF
ncbi:P-loop containing nucleoside triphosphate hydrolase protein, partial [Rhodofomes roseus]